MKTKLSAIRELFEELGVHAKAEDLVYCGTRRVVYDGEFCGKLFHDRQVSKVFYLWFDADESAFNIDSAEVDRVLWMNLDACIDGVRHNTFPHCIEMDELEILCSGLKVDFCISFLPRNDLHRGIGIVGKQGKILFQPVRNVDRAVRCNENRFKVAAFCPESSGFF